VLQTIRETVPLVTSAMVFNMEPKAGESPLPTTRYHSKGFISGTLLTISLAIAVDGLVGVILPRSARLPGFAVPVLAGLALAWLVVRSRVVPGRPLASDGFVFGGVLLTVVALGRSATNWPFLGPVGYSVDGAHHGAMVTWIAEHGRLPDRIEPELRQFSEYFLFTHRVIADLSRVAGLLPLRAMGIFGLFLAVLSLAASAVLADSLSHSVGADIWVRGAAIGAVFAAGASAHAYGLDMVLENYYLAHLCALLLCSVACICLVDPKFRSLIPIIGGASIACYPLQAGVIPGVMLLMWFVVRKRWIVSTLLRTLAIGTVALIAQAPYLGRALAMSQDEGSVVGLSLHSAGGPLVVLILALGFMEALTQIRQIRLSAEPPFAPLVVTSGFIVTTAQFAVFRLGAAAGLVSHYSANKTVFLIAPFGLALAGFGTARLAQELADHSTVARAVAAFGVPILAIVAFSLTRSQYRETNRLVNADAYQLARSLPKGVSTTDVGIAGINLDPYFLWWTGLARPVTPTAYRLLELNRPFDDWPRNSPEHYLIVDGALAIQRYSSFPEVSVVRRLGSAALLRRGDN
jgi:hypothetical protein